jgi:histidinol-phosphatase
MGDRALDDDLELALRAGDLAGELALARFRSGVEVSLKPDGSPVTEADRAVEELLRETVTRARPGDAVLGEELGHAPGSERVWVLDPIDGTGLFGRGDPNWRIHLCLQVHDVPQVAVVISPALAVCWWATRGGGAFESSWPRTPARTRALAVSTTSVLAEAALEALDDESRARLPRVAATQRPVGPLPLVELVRGEIDAFLAERYFIWDHAPWILLVEEAGGRFTDRSGGRAGDQGGGLYSNAALHDRLLAELGYPTRP